MKIRLYHRSFIFGDAFSNINMKDPIRYLTVVDIAPTTLVVKI